MIAGILGQNEVERKLEPLNRFSFLVEFDGLLRREIGKIWSGNV